MPPKDYVSRQATRYNCKYCQTFVRNTPLEKRNHEATPRHQGKLQHFLRDLHRTNEREARDAQRTQDELARLNGKRKDGSAPETQVRATVGSGTPASSSLAAVRPATGQAAAASVQARAVGREERQRQMAQLAAMGVVVPDEFRKENAMLGEWEAAAVESAPKHQMAGRADRASGQVRAKDEERKRDGQDGDEADREGRSYGVRKRKLEGEDEEDASVDVRRKPRWGQDVKSYGGIGVDDDLEALLESTGTIRAKKEVEADNAGGLQSEAPEIKREAKDNQTIIGALDAGAALANETVIRDKANEIIRDEEQTDIGSMFKRRAPKFLRQK